MVSFFPSCGMFPLYASNLSPHGKALLSTPLAAFSHSGSVGSLFPSHRQKSFASYQLTKTTGCSARSAGISPLTQWAGGVRLRASTNFLYLLLVTSYLSI